MTIQPFDENATEEEREVMLFMLLVSRKFASVGVHMFNSIEEYNEAFERTQMLLDELGGLSEVIVLDIEDGEGVRFRFSDTMIEAARDGTLQALNDDFESV